MCRNACNHSLDDWKERGGERRKKKSGEREGEEEAGGRVVSVFEI